MRTHATSRIGETGLKILNGFLIFFNGFPIFLNGFPKSSTAFRFPRNPRKSIYGEKYAKDHYLSFVFFATCSPTRAPSFVIPATIPNSYQHSNKYYLKHIVQVLLDRSHNRHLVFVTKDKPMLYPYSSRLVSQL